MAFFVISNHVGMRFGRNVLHVNTRCLTELDFCFDVIISRWRPWRHFTQNCAATWWMHTQRLPSSNASMPVSSWPIVHS